MGGDGDASAEARKGECAAPRRRELGVPLPGTFVMMLDGEPLKGEADGRVLGDERTGVPSAWAEVEEEERIGPPDVGRAGLLEPGRGASVVEADGSDESLLRVRKESMML